MWLAKHILFASILLLSCERQDKGKTRSLEADTRKPRLDRLPNEDAIKRTSIRNALNEASSIGEKSERNIALSSVAWNAMESTPDLALQAILELPVGSAEKEPLLQVYAQNLGKENADSAILWANSLLDESERNLAKEQISLVLKETEPLAAMQVLPEVFSAETGLLPAAEQVLTTWVVKDPEKALAWVSELPEGKTRNAGFESALAKWLQTDAESALKWANAQQYSNQPEIIEGLAFATNGYLEATRLSILEKAAPRLREELERKLSEHDRTSKEAQLRDQAEFEDSLMQSPDQRENDKFENPAGESIQPDTH